MAKGGGREGAGESKGTRRVRVREREREREKDKRKRELARRGNPAESAGGTNEPRNSLRVCICVLSVLKKGRRGMSETMGGKKYTPEEEEGGFRPVADINARETSDCCKQEKGWRRSSPWPAFAFMRSLEFSSTDSDWYPRG